MISEKNYNKCKMYFPSSISPAKESLYYFSPVFSLRFQKAIEVGLECYKKKKAFFSLNTKF